MLPLSLKGVGVQMKNFTLKRTVTLTSALLQQTDPVFSRALWFVFGKPKIRQHPLGEKMGRLRDVSFFRRQQQEYECGTGSYRELGNGPQGERGAGDTH